MTIREYNSGHTTFLINVLYKGKDNTIWAGTQSGGICRYSWTEDEFVPLVQGYFSLMKIHNIRHSTWGMIHRKLPLSIPFQLFNTRLQKWIL